MRLKKLGVKKLEGLILRNNKITDVNALTKLKKLKMLVFIPTFNRVR